MVTGSGVNGVAQGRDGAHDDGHEREGEGKRHPEPPNEAIGEVLQPSRRADADGGSHQETQVERARMDQESLEDVHVTAQMRPAHPAGVIDVRERPLDALPTAAHEAPSARAANPPPIPMRRRLGLRVCLTREDSRDT